MPWLILIFLMAAGGGYAYHVSIVSGLESQVVQLEANNRTLKENQVQLDLAVKTSQKALKDAEEAAKKSEVAMSKLTAKNMQLQKDKDNAMKIFRDHNLTRLARAKPGMIEKRANAKTASVFRALENDTKELMGIDDGKPDASGVSVDANVVQPGTDTSGAADSNGS